MGAHFPSQGKPKTLGFPSPQNSSAVLLGVVWGVDNGWKYDKLIPVQFRRLNVAEPVGVVGRKQEDVRGDELVVLHADDISHLQGDELFMSHDASRRVTHDNYKGNVL